MLINEECGNLQVVVDIEELTRNNIRKKNSEVLQAYRCQIREKSYRRDWGKHDFYCGCFFAGR